ncbi:MAG: hypothetical protein LBG72_02185 [Spirochaetaceae bacterium]|jgi:uncharacterized coiled-coil protein SlyX|nr:hypothetical protein [Spirochaetaceae bacterium]
MMGKTNIKPQKGVTFEDVWAALLKTDAQLAELGECTKRTDAQLAELGKCTKRTDAQLAELGEYMKRTEAESHKRTEEINAIIAEMKKNSEEADARIAKMDKRMGDIHNSIGDLTEALIAARLWEKFDGYPYNFKRAYLNTQIFDDDNEQIGEIDILLSNTKWVMPVEVKRKLKVGDIEHHRKRMELIRKYPPAEAKGKKMLGAVAGGFVTKEARDAAFSAGFFVVELTGESAALCPPPAGFKPKEWKQSSK